MYPLIGYQEGVQKVQSAVHFRWAVSTATRLFVHRPLRQTTPPLDGPPDAIAGAYPYDIYKVSSLIRGVYI
jgi:hypothetical protein